MASPSELQGDAKKNFIILKKFATKLPHQFTMYRFSKRLLSSLPKPDIIVDAMFGTGFAGSVRKPSTDVIDWMNKQGGEIVSVDIPSGVNGTTGVVENCAVRANITVTFGSIKSGLLCNQGRELVGFVYKTDIGIP